MILEIFFGTKTINCVTKKHYIFYNNMNASTFSKGEKGIFFSN